MLLGNSRKALSFLIALASGGWWNIYLCLEGLRVLPSGERWEKTNLSVKKENKRQQGENKAIKKWAKDLNGHSPPPQKKYKQPMIQEDSQEL